MKQQPLQNNQRKSKLYINDIFTLITSGLEQEVACNKYLSSTRQNIFEGLCSSDELGKTVLTCTLGTRPLKTMKYHVPHHLNFLNLNYQVPQEECLLPLQGNPSW